MSQNSSVFPPESFASFGALLKYLRRRAQLSQKQLAIAVGYNHAQISRLEKNQRLPDLTTLAALFVPALSLNDQPEVVARLLELAAAARHESLAGRTISFTQALPERKALVDSLESVPLPPLCEVPRTRMLARVHERMSEEQRVALCGMAGSGKTTLAATLAREYGRNAPVFWHSFSEGGDVSLEALVRQLALFLLTLGREQAASLLQPRSRHEGAPTDEQQIYMLCAGLKNGRARALLCLDNVHLVAHDPRMLRLLNRLIEATPAALLMTSREQVPWPQVAIVSLTGLEESEGLALIARLGGRWEAEGAERLLRKTGGNPMLLRLALGHLVDARERSLERETLIEGLESQPQVASYLFESVLRQLDTPASHLLALLSVFRHPIDLHDELLVELSRAADGAYDFNAAIASLQRRFLIDHAGAAQLHPLVRDHLYAALAAAPERRRRLHRVAAQWEERARGDHLEAAYQDARAQRLGRAAQALTQHVEEFIAKGQVEAASLVVDEVLAQTRRRRGNAAGVRLELLAARGYLLTGTLRAAEAESSYREALTLSAQPAVRAQLTYHLADILLQRAQAAEALQLVESAAAPLAESDTLLRAQLATSAADAQAALLYYGEAAQSAQRGLRLAEQLAGVPAPIVEEIRARAHYRLGTLATAHSEFEVSLEHYRRAVVSARLSNLRRLEDAALAAIGKVHFLRGDLQSSTRIYREALERSRAIHHLAAVGNHLLSLHINYYILCDLPAALDALDEAGELMRSMGDARGAAHVERRRVLWLLASGRPAEARAVAERLLHEVERNDFQTMLGDCHSNLSAALMVLGEVAEAQATLRCALALPVCGEEPRIRAELQSHLALACLAAGNLDEATQALPNEPSLAEINAWVNLNFQLIKGLVAVASGQASAAAKIAARLSEQTRGFPLYAQRAERLAAAVREPPPFADYPKVLWGAVASAASQTAR